MFDPNRERALELATRTPGADQHQIVDLAETYYTFLMGTAVGAKQPAVKTKKAKKARK